MATNKTAASKGLSKVYLPPNQFINNIQNIFTKIKSTDFLRNITWVELTNKKSSFGNIIFWIFRKLNPDMAGVTGLEPAASGVTGRRSNQLSYTPVSGVVEDSGIEPLTSWMQIRRSPGWANPPLTINYIQKCKLLVNLDRFDVWFHQLG